MTGKIECETLLITRMDIVRNKARRILWDKVQPLSVYYYFGYLHCKFVISLFILYLNPKEIKLSFLIAFLYGFLIKSAKVRKHCSSRVLYCILFVILSSTFDSRSGHFAIDAILNRITAICARARVQIPILHLVTRR